MEKPSSPERGKRWPFRRKARTGASRARRLRTIALLPTLITLANGVCGVIAVFKIGIGLAKGGELIYFQQAAWLILAAMVFDALDGFVARVTKTTSAFGAQLDSLCDLITFGVAPAFLVYGVTRPMVFDTPWDEPVQAVCVLYSMCALIRLARFTVETTPDESSHREFAGLPSPAAAGVLAAAVLPVRGAIMEFLPDVVTVLTAVLPGLALATGVLMVSRVRYLHLVNRLLKGRRPFVTLVEIALTVTLAVIFREFAFFLAFFGYAATGPIFWIKRRIVRRPAPATASPDPAPKQQPGEPLF